MEKLINEIITGFIILAVWSALHGFTKSMGEKAAEAHRQGPMSYLKYTKKLTE